MAYHVATSEGRTLGPMPTQPGATYIVESSRFATQVVTSAPVTAQLTKYESNFPLHWVATQGLHQSVRYLVLNGFDPNEPDTSKDTPVHCAARQNHGLAIQILFTMGANLFAKNSFKETPLDVARSVSSGLAIYVLEKLAKTPAGVDQAANAVRYNEDRHRVWQLPDAPPPFRPANKKLREWTADDVAFWMVSLSLSQDYSHVILDHAVDGEVLSDMRTKQDWAGLNIVALGDVRKLLRLQKELRTG